MIERRTALGLFGAVAAAASAGGAFGAPVPPAFDFDRPDDRLRAYMLMRGALDDRLVIGCVSGEYFGVVDQTLTPLFGVVAATFARYRPRPGGGYDAATMEHAYFTDLTTGKALTEFRNPYTGETNPVPAGGSPASAIAILPGPTLKLGRDFPGTVFDQQIQPPVQRGGDIWIAELTRTSSKRPGQEKSSHYSEMTTMHARLSELGQPGIKRVTCETSFTNVVSWRPWLKMGDRPGNMMAIGAGRYGATLDTLPPAWIAAAQVDRPELIANPAVLLDPVWSKFQ